MTFEQALRSYDRTLQLASMGAAEEWSPAYDEDLGGSQWQETEEQRTEDFAPYDETALKEERSGILFGEKEGD